MRYRILSADGDYTFGGGLKNFYIDVPDAPAQAVQTRLLLWKNEWYLDSTAGTPYAEGILGKKSQEEADLTIQNVILQTQAVTGIINYSSDLNRDTRRLSVEATINTLYGPSDIEILNYVNY